MKFSPPFLDSTFPLFLKTIISLFQLIFRFCPPFSMAGDTRRYYLFSRNIKIIQQLIKIYNFVSLLLQTLGIKILSLGSRKKFSFTQLLLKVFDMIFRWQLSLTSFALCFYHTNRYRFSNFCIGQAYYSIGTKGTVQ